MGRTKLHDAAIRGDIEEVSRYLLEEHCEVNEEWLGLTPLCYAAANNHIGVVEILVDNKAHVNRGRFTPLNAAAEAGHVEIVKLLLKHGAYPSEVDEWGWTPLNHALEQMHNSTEVAEILLNHKADINKGHHLPLHTAVENDNQGVVKWLLERGADPNKKDRLGESSLDKVKDKNSPLYAMLLESLKGDGSWVNLHANKIYESDSPNKDSDKNNSKINSILDYSMKDSKTDTLEKALGEATEKYYNSSRTIKPDVPVSVSCVVTLAQDISQTKIENLQLNIVGTSTKTFKATPSVAIVSKTHHEKMTRNLVELTKKLHNLDYICDYLIAASVITYDDAEAIMAEQTDRRRASKLLRKYLFKKDERAIDVFCKALRKEGQNHLAEIIEG